MSTTEDMNPLDASLSKVKQVNSNNSDEKRDEILNTDQETHETNNSQDDMPLNSFHGEHRLNHHPYNLYLTTITEEIDHEKTLVGLKEQNNKLTEQLRFLNQKLTEILSKQQKKAQSKQALEQNSKDTTLIQKELDNTYKKVEYLSKQNKFLQQKIEKLSPTMIQSLENQLREKESLIQKQQDEIKVYDNIKRMIAKNNPTETKQIEAISKVDDQEKIIIQMNSEIKKLKQIIANNQKQMIKKQEYQIDLEQKYREICDYTGISSHIKANLKEEFQKIQVTKKSESAAAIIRQQQQNVDSANQINFQEKEKNIDLNIKKSQQKAQETQIKELTLLLNLKDKDIVQLKQQIQQFKSISQTPQPQILKSHRSNHSLIVKSNVISPLQQGLKAQNLQERKLEKIGQILAQNKSVPKVVIKEYIQNNKENIQEVKLQLNPLKDLNEKVKKIVMGKQQACSRVVSDRVILKETLHTKIVKIIVWSNKRTINGLQFFYKLNNSDTIIEGQQIVVDKYNEYTQTICDFTKKQSDYLKCIECVISPQGFIDRVKFTSAKAQIFEVGAQLTQAGQVQKYHIDEYEYPICAYAGLITFVGEQEQETGGILSYLGFEIMIDQRIERRSQSKYTPQGFSTFFFDKELLSQHHMQVKQQNLDIFDSYNNSQ